MSHKNMQYFLSKQAEVTNRTLFAIILPIVATPNASSAHSKGVRQTKNTAHPLNSLYSHCPRKAVETF